VGKTKDERTQKVQCENLWKVDALKKKRMGRG
jgi:hypothetical protein